MAAAFVASSAGLMLTGCGGGGTSAGFGGPGNGGTGGASSTIMLHVAPGAHAALEPQPGVREQLLAALSEWAIRNALAQTADVEVFLDGVSQGMTDVNGDIMFQADAGMHQVCIGATTEPPGVCFDVNVDPDTLVSVNITGVNVDGTTSEITYNVSVDPVVDDVVDPTDPNNPNKTLVCHKGKFTISVGTPAAYAGHTTHGDTLGPCEVAGGGDTTIQSTNTSTGNKGNGNNGNKGNNGNNGNKGNPNA